MILTSSLKRICDICLYLAFASFIGSFFGAGSLLIALPILALTALLATSIKIPYLALPLGLLAFWAVPSSLANWIILVPPLLYLGAGKALLSYENLIATFKIAMKATLLLIALILAVSLGHDGMWSSFTAQILPFIMGFFWGYIYLLRIARHEGSYTLTNHFKVLNFLSLLGFVIVGLFVAIPRLWGLLFIYLLQPIILGAIYVIIWVLSRIIPDFELDYKPVVNELELPLCWDEERGAYTVCPIPVGDELAYSPPNPLFPLLVYLLTGLSIIALLTYLVKKFKNRPQKEETSIGVTETRISLNPPKSKLPKQKRLDNPIRETYRQFLKYCNKNKLDIKPHMTSQQVEATAHSKFQAPQSESLRALYLKTRYGEDAPKKEEMLRAKEYLKSIKKQGK